MRTEFFSDQTNTFRQADNVKIKDDDWKPLDEATEKEVNIFYSIMTAEKRSRDYMMLHLKKGIQDKKELVRLCVRKFFRALTPEPDIDDNGKLHFETN